MFIICDQILIIYKRFTIAVLSKACNCFKEATSLEESFEEESTNSGLPILLETIISDLEKSLGTALSSILETEMKIAFGNLWMEVIISTLLVENLFFIAKDWLPYFKKFYLYKMCKLHCNNLYHVFFLDVFEITF